MEADSWDCRASFIFRECWGEDPQKSAGALNSEREGEGGAVRTCNPWQLVSREVQERGMGMGGPGQWSCTGVGMGGPLTHKSSLSHHITLLLVL